MAALPARALRGSGQEPIGTDPQSGGLQPQAHGPDYGIERGMNRELRTDDPMKNEHHYKLEPTDATAPGQNFDPHSLYFQNTPFAEISEGVAANHNTEGCNPFRVEGIQQRPRVVASLQPW